MPKKRVGRPRKAVKEVNTVRQVGRWTDEDWELVKRAAAKAGVPVSDWARDKLLKAAKRAIG